MRSHMNWTTIFNKYVIGICVLVLALVVTGCGDRPSSNQPASLSSRSFKRFAKEIVEVSPPASIQSLRRAIDGYEPQVQILSPRFGEVLYDTTVSVKFQVNDLPLFKDEASGLGPHLHVVLDNQKYQAVYDTAQPITFNDLEPGTHTIRAFASRPWHESFKNAGAYAQVTFDVFTDTANSDPIESQPLLTYSRPASSYGAEPIMLDFYLSDAPLHVLARESADDDIEDWQIRGTVNGQRFTFDTWEPIYLTGFVPGLNWVKLELIDSNGTVIDGPFNSTARLIDYAPGGDDALSRLIRGELSTDAMMQMVDPDYEPMPVIIEPEVIEPESPQPDVLESETVEPEVPDEEAADESELSDDASALSEPIEEEEATVFDSPEELKEQEPEPSDAASDESSVVNTEDAQGQASFDEITEPLSTEPLEGDMRSIESPLEEPDTIDQQIPSERDADEMRELTVAPTLDSTDTPESAVDESSRLPDTAIKPMQVETESIPMDSASATEITIDAAVDSPIEEGIDVMPSELNDPDEEVAAVSDALDTVQDDDRQDEMLSEEAIAKPTRQPPLIRPIHDYRVFQI